LRISWGREFLIHCPTRLGVEYNIGGLTSLSNTGPLNAVFSF